MNHIDFSVTTAWDTLAYEVCDSTCAYLAEPRPLSIHFAIDG